MHACTTLACSINHLHCTTASHPSSFISLCSLSLHPRRSHSCQVPAPMHRPAQPSCLSQAQPQGSSTTPQHRCDCTSIIRVCLSHFPVSSFPFVRPFWVPYYTTLTYSFRLVPLCSCLAPRSYPRYRLHFHVLRFVSRAHCLSLYSDSLSLSLGLFSAPFYSYSYS